MDSDRECLAPVNMLVRGQKELVEARHAMEEHLRRYSSAGVAAASQDLFVAAANAHRH